MRKPVLDTCRMCLCPALSWQFVLNFCFLYESVSIFWSSVKKTFRLFLWSLYIPKAIEMTGIGTKEVYLYNRLFQEKLQLRQSSALPAHSKKILILLSSVGRLKNYRVCRWELSWLLWDVVSPILQSHFKAKTSFFLNGGCVSDVMTNMLWRKENVCGLEFRIHRSNAVNSVLFYAK